MEQQELDSLIDKANDVIEDYYKHRSSTINLWITYAPIPGNYVICVENAMAPGDGISTVNALELSDDKCNYEDFIKIIDGLHNKWPNTPLLFHDLSEARLNKLRDKYGSFIVRDDIVIQKK